MTIAELTEEMHRFVASKGFYREDSHRPQVPRNLAISLVLEASEVLEHFQWNEQPPDAEELGDELADVALYLLQLASVSGIDLEQSILRKLGKNAGREWPKQS
ncbi:MAG: nucleotide pyrophosphohydrolase [Vulcanimicrobiota bacterium]